MNQERLTDAALLLLRIGTGVVMVFYGGQKLFGWFGGLGVEATMRGMSEQLGAPPALVILAIVAEFFGGLGVLVGALTRLAAFGIFATMAVAVAAKVREVAAPGADLAPAEAVQAVMWPGSWMLIALALVLVGPGSLAVDSAIFKKKK